MSQVLNLNVKSMNFGVDPIKVKELRVQTLNQRVRHSELFPRIRDAELQMKKNDDDFHKMIAEKNFLKKHRKMLKLQEEAQRRKGLLLPKPTPKVISPTKQYFSAFVLNKDPSSSAYMPFDTVYYPKLFDEQTKRQPPHSIDSVWMLGFQDLAIREQNRER